MSYKHLVTNLYRNYPKCVQVVAKRVYCKIPALIRYGKVFRDTYSFLQKSQWWSKDQLEEYQLEKLSMLLKHAYENVPYYRKCFDERGLKPRDIQDFEDMKKLPYMTKERFRRNFKEMVAKNTNFGRVHLGHTTGTTGSALNFYEDDVTASMERAFILQQWGRVGFVIGDKRAELRGAPRDIPITYDLVEKVLWLSPVGISEERAKEYLEALEKYKVKFLHGYPSAIAVFASVIRHFGIPVKVHLRAVLFASEIVYEWERRIVEEVFSCRAFSHYGMGEKVVLASECENSSDYHVFPQYSFVELDEKTNEIMGTSFLNYVNPFIRYKTTDVADTVRWEGCRSCGRNYYPIIAKIKGRLEDFVLTPEGMFVSPAVLTWPFKVLNGIKETQIYQETVDKMTIRVLPWRKVDRDIIERDKRRILEGLRRIVGDSMTIVFEEVDETSRTSVGKFQWVISVPAKELIKKGI